MGGSDGRQPLWKRNSCSPGKVISVGSCILKSISSVVTSARCSSRDILLRAGGCGMKVSLLVPWEPESVSCFRGASALSLLPPIKGVGRVFLKMQASGRSHLHFFHKEPWGDFYWLFIETCSKGLTWGCSTSGFSVMSMSFWLCLHPNKRYRSFRLGPRNLDQHRIFTRMKGGPARTWISLSL